jgi:predicted GNAT family acetyltransferase
MANPDVNNLEIEHNRDAQRWETHVGEEVAVATYQRRGNTIFFTHTGVPAALEGQGIGSKLVKAVLDDARAQELEVVPYCSFAAAYIRRHPEYRNLVPPAYQNLI